MAIRIEDGCVGCPEELGCLGDACPNKNIIESECDECGDQCHVDDLYVYEDELMPDGTPKMLCSYCLCKKFETVEQYGIENFC